MKQLVLRVGSVMDFDCLLKHVSGTLWILVDVVQSKPGHTQPWEVNSWKNIPMEYQFCAYQQQLYLYWGWWGSGQGAVDHRFLDKATMSSDYWQDTECDSDLLRDTGMAGLSARWQTSTANGVIIIFMIEWITLYSIPCRIPCLEYQALPESWLLLSTTSPPVEQSGQITQHLKSAALTSVNLNRNGTPKTLWAAYTVIIIIKQWTSTSTTFWKCATGMSASFSARSISSLRTSCQLTTHSVMSSSLTGYSPSLQPPPLLPHFTSTLYIFCANSSLTGRS